MSCRHLAVGDETDAGVGDHAHGGREDEQIGVGGEGPGALAVRQQDQNASPSMRTPSRESNATDAPLNGRSTGLPEPAVE